MNFTSLESTHRQSKEDIRAPCRPVSQFGQILEAIHWSWGYYFILINNLCMTMLLSILINNVIFTQHHQCTMISGSQGKLIACIISGSQVILFLILFSFMRWYCCMFICNSIKTLLMVLECFSLYYLCQFLASCVISLRLLWFGSH